MRKRAGTILLILAVVFGTGAVLIAPLHWGVGVSVAYASGAGSGGGGGGGSGGGDSGDGSTGDAAASDAATADAATANSENATSMHGHGSYCDASCLGSGTYSYFGGGDGTFSPPPSTPPPYTCGAWGFVCTCTYGGTYPNCLPGPSCPAGTTGVYPNCKGLGTGSCPAGDTGVYPNCIASNGTGGTANASASCVNGSGAVTIIWNSPHPVVTVHFSDPGNNVLEYGIFPGNGSYSQAGLNPGVYGWFVDDQPATDFKVQENVVVPSCSACSIGYTLDAKGLCTYTGCPSGYALNGSSCIANACPSGYSGTFPNCTPPPCPSGEVGTYPNCKAACIPSYVCNADGQLYFQSADCSVSGTPKKPLCSYGCAGSTCKLPSAPFVVVWALHPSIVQSGGTTSITWRVENVTSCTVTGSNGDGAGGAWSCAGSACNTPITRTSSIISAQTIYTLHCAIIPGAVNVNGTPAVWADQTATVNIVPGFNEQ